MIFRFQTLYNLRFAGDHIPDSQKRVGPIGRIHVHITAKVFCFLALSILIQICVVADRKLFIKQVLAFVGFCYLKIFGKAVIIIFNVKKLLNHRFLIRL